MKQRLAGRWHIQSHEFRVDGGFEERESLISECWRIIFEPYVHCPNINKILILILIIFLVGRLPKPSFCYFV